MLADTANHFEIYPHNDCQKYTTVFLTNKDNLRYKVLEFININDTEVLLVQLSTDTKALIWTDENNAISILPLSV